jgi:hypothetical protein
VFERLDAAARTAELVATGQDVRGKGGADLRLTSSVKALPGGRTEVTAVSLVNVTGILAQMGRGMIQDVSDEMFQIFSERMRAELESGAPASPTDGAAPGAPSQVAAPAPEGGVPTLGGAPAAGAGAAPSPRPAASTAGRSGSAPPAAPEALDAAALGARVARRSAARWARQPAFWVVVLAVLGAVLYLSLHRSS